MNILNKIKKYISFFLLKYNPYQESYKIENGAKIYSRNIPIGDFTFISRGAEIGPNCVSIGKFSSIAPGAIVGPNIHMLNSISSSSSLYKFGSVDAYKRNEKLPYADLITKMFNNSPTIIGNDVWIGANAIILPGRVVSDGAVVGAGAVVTKDVEPYTIVVGNPARSIKKRFSDKIIQKLIEIDLYSNDPDKIYSVFSTYALIEIDESILDEIIEKINYK